MGAGKQRSRERRVKGIILLAMPEQQKTIAARHDAIARSRQWQLSALSGIGGFWFWPQMRHSSVRLRTADRVVFSLPDLPGL